MKEWQSQDKFSESIRKKVEEYGQDPSEGVWGGLESRLDALQAADRRKKPAAWIFILPVILLIGGTMFFFTSGQKEPLTQYPVVKGRAAAEVKETTAGRPGAGPAALAKKRAVVAQTRSVQLPEASSVNYTNSKESPRLRQSQSLAKNSSNAGNSENIHTRAVLPERLAEAGLGKRGKKSPLQMAAFVARGQASELNTGNTIMQAASPVVAVYDSSIKGVASPDLLLSIPVKGFGSQARAGFGKMPQALEKKTEAGREPAVSPLSIAIVNNVSFSGMQIEQPGAYTAGSRYYGMETLVRKLQSGRINYSGGFSVGFRFNDRLMLSVGLRMSTLSEKYSYDTISVSKDPSNAARYNEKFSTARIGNFYKNAFDSIIPGNRFNFINRYSWREIPVTLTYYLPLKNKWSGFVEGGLSFMQASYVNAAYVDEDRIGFIILEEKESYPVIQNTTAAMLSLGISYRHNSRFSFEISPGARYALRSITENKVWVQQKPYFVGLSFTVRRHF